METNESSRMAVLKRVGTAVVDIFRRPFEVGKDDPERLSFRNVAGQFLTESGGPLATGDELNPIPPDTIAAELGVFSLDPNKNFRAEFPKSSAVVRIHIDELVRRKILAPQLLKQPNRRGETIGYVVLNRKGLEEIWKSPENKVPKP